MSNLTAETDEEGSLYVPTTASGFDTFVSFQQQSSNSFEKLNDFLKSRDVSPVRNVLQTEWSEASGRTQRRHVRKASQTVHAVLEEIAPNQSSTLWKAVKSSGLLQNMPADTESESEPIDAVFMEAIKDCYNNANTWQTRRQILSIIADKLDYNTLNRWIPEVTRWRFNEARKHALLNGRGVPLEKSSQTRMYVSPSQVDHFLEFITSSHISQDMPFGEKTILLSTKEVLRVPNIIRVMIPESIVQQYLSYADECSFKPLSRSTLLRILSVCSASSRKSLQGLDYISATGTQGFDDLHEIVERLGETCMDMTWADHQEKRLKSAKRYLKRDFKVRYLISVFAPLIA